MVRTSTASTSPHLFFEFGLVDMVLECLGSIDEYYRNLFAVIFLEVRIRLDVNHSQREGKSPLHPFDDDLRVVAQMTTGTGVNVNLNGIFHGQPRRAELPEYRGEESLSATDVQSDWARSSSAELNFLSSRSRCRNSRRAFSSRRVRERSTRTSRSSKRIRQTSAGCRYW